MFAAPALSESSVDNDLRYSIHLLGDPIAGKEEKLAAVERLTCRAAIAHLIARVNDTWDAVFLDEFLVETGPMNVGPARVVRVTARFVAELILYRLISPIAEAQPLALGARLSSTGIDSTRPAGLFSIVPERPPIAWVRDWSAFWKAHQHESLDELRAWSAREIDAVWSNIALGQPPASTALARASFAYTANLAGPWEPQRSVLEAWRDPGLNATRKTYARARQIYLAAKRDPAKRVAARKSIEQLGASDPRLDVHVEYWLAAL